VTPNPYAAGHLTALRRFGIIITLVTVLGHTVFGFEASYAQPLVALAVGYSAQLLLELLEAWSQRRRPRFLGGPRRLIDFLLPAHITALAIAMLLYFNDRLWVVAFTVATAIASKTLFRAPYGAGTRHYFNPSNFGITLTLLLFPSVGLIMPWQFTTELDGAADWVFPAFIWASGGFLNTKLTRRFPLIAAWLGGFVLQAVVRSQLFGVSLPASLAPMTGVTFALLTFYMITDPVTTPDRPWKQVAFGLGVAALYGLFMAIHVVYGIFAALTIVCAIRGGWLYITAWRARGAAVPAPAPAELVTVPVARG
jgi:enediyne biosynthesis protein E5